MMMKKTNNKPMLDHEKQSQPLAGETSPEEALLKANIFAELEKKQLEAKKPKGGQK